MSQKILPKQAEIAAAVHDHRPQYAMDWLQVIKAQVRVLWFVTIDIQNPQGRKGIRRSMVNVTKT